MFLRLAAVVLCLSIAGQVLGLPDKPLDAYLAGTATKDEIVAAVMQDPSAFEQKILSLRSEAAGRKLSQGQVVQIYQLEKAITKAAADYNAKSGGSVGYNIGGAVIGAAAGGIGLRVATRKWGVSSSWAGAAIGNAASFGVAIIGGLGGGLAGYIITDVAMSRADVNADVEILK